ncbi:MAG: adenylyl-sulfate kinase [Desulfobaccales bacterium]
MFPQTVYTATRGFTVWLTGLSGAGKSTLANAFRAHLTASGVLNLAIFDGDDVRIFLCRDLGYSREDRDANICRIGYLCKMLTHHGVPNTVAVISPYLHTRQKVRQMVGDLVEVYVSCPLEVCERRDVKGLYARARAGEVKMFTGIDDPYEPPENPEVTVYTHQETVEQGVQKIIAALVERNYLRKTISEQEFCQDIKAITKMMEKLGYIS